MTSFVAVLVALGGADARRDGVVRAAVDGLAVLDRLAHRDSERLRGGPPARESATTPPAAQRV
ncbi:hypothetical protein [Aquipuribacter nitratireducens]|uniref:Uncharacterized protein n=1 Tax=Aquipuribacter nitratireducens TaxID=650104 RepID=A0ABW0GI66_9MICO